MTRQPNEPFWDHQASLPGLRAVMDPNDAASHKNAYLDCLQKTALRRHGRFEASDRLLDFGCGSGRIALWLASRVASVHGVDANLSMVRRAAREGEHGQLANVCFTPYDGLRLPFRTDAFTRVTSVWVVQHVIEDEVATRLFSELARVTRRAGELYFIERVSDEPSEPWLPPGVIRRRSLEEYRRLFAGSGLEQMLCRPVWSSRPAWRSRRMERLLTRRALPAWLLRTVAWVDLATRESRVRGDWADYLFVCRKSFPEARARS